ncbi:DNA ligase [Actinobacillus equuli subsp. haemolyticus]|uniref:DNA ligase n=1 Tax=Actinobacillus equuli TaxID=718 RepID=UPI0024430682|nr:DNA ligase [Actinobacillus equuli]WGE52916.1 DNA ligase [Actinobacillus equuli subsp. haemolyticus]WGE63168.1 DNA ligase [Actinobacillus equuli subsp. haemolyticus]WGE73352.1 DNA ligase [Actinobacillus equuli subsp. haemolyticus]
MKTVLFILLCFSTSLFAKTPDLMLLGQYRDQDINGWVMSEKLDGIRGYWDGKQLISRQGNPLAPPDYFIKDFPPFAIDGELFSERGKFEEISSTVRASEPKGWYKLKLYVFDVPNADGNLFERLTKLKNYLSQHPTPYIQIIEQIPIQDKAHLMQFYQQVLDQYGEGVVVRNPNTAYIKGRSAQILKLKPVLDEECTVIAHHNGKGKYRDKLGAITCENQRGRFRIGSGFKDKDRENPPPIGSLITYKYRGITEKGKPRFATFFRQRMDVTPNTLPLQ